MCSRDGEYLYSEKEACAKVGVNQSSFRRLKAGKSIGENKTGRNRKLTLAACEEINKEQTEKSMNLDSAKASDMSNIFQKNFDKSSATMCIPLQGLLNCAEIQLKNTSKMRDWLFVRGARKIPQDRMHF